MAVNVSVELRPGESSERLIKRFIKKCKKEDVIREYLTKTSFHRTKSQKRREKIRKNRHLRQREKNNTKMQEKDN